MYEREQKGNTLLNQDHEISYKKIRQQWNWSMFVTFQRFASIKFPIENYLLIIACLNQMTLFFFQLFEFVERTMRTINIISCKSIFYLLSMIIASFNDCVRYACSRNNLLDKMNFHLQPNISTLMGYLRPFCIQIICTTTWIIFRARILKKQFDSQKGLCVIHQAQVFEFLLYILSNTNRNEIFQMDIKKRQRMRQEISRLEQSYRNKCDTELT